MSTLPLFILAGALHDVTNRPPQTHTNHRTGVDQSLLPEGSPEFGIGPRAGGLVQAGGVDEWLDIDEFLQLVAVVALTTARWCTREPA